MHVWEESKDSHARARSNVRGTAPTENNPHAMLLFLVFYLPVVIFSRVLISVARALQKPTSWRRVRLHNRKRMRDRCIYAFPVAVFREQKERVGREREALSHSDGDRYGQTGTIAYGHMGYERATVNGAGGEGRRAERLGARGLADA